MKTFDEIKQTKNLLIEQAGEVGGCGFIYLGGTKGRPHTARNARSATVNKIKKTPPRASSESGKPNKTNYIITDRRRFVK